MQINFINQKQANWLLYLGGVLLPLSMFFVIFFTTDNQQINSRQFISSKFELYAFSAIIIAPIVEELVFRGFFSKKKSLRFLSLATIPLFVYYSSNNIITYYLLFVYIIFALLYLFKGKKMLVNFLYVLNASIFSVLHYNVTDFNQISTSFPFLIQFSIGLILIWLVINFGLLRAMVFHFIWNSITIAIMFYGVQFVGDELRIIQKEEYTMITREVPKYSSCVSRFSYDKTSIKINCMELSNILNIINKNKLNNVYPTTPFLKYNLELKFKNDVNQNQMNETLFKSLIENEFVRVVD